MSPFERAVRDVLARTALLVGEGSLPVDLSEWKTEVRARMDAKYGDAANDVLDRLSRMLEDDPPALALISSTRLSEHPVLVMELAAMAVGRLQ